MNESKEVKVLDHDYDGIQEFDNPLPNWWLATFYGAVIYSVLYVAYYHFGSAKTPEEELSLEMKQIQTQELASRKAEPGPTEDDLLAVFQDNSRRESGHKAYTEKCAACHGPDGGGGIGPNLTDSYWIHGNGSLLDLVQVVSDGVADKGMPPWKTMLKKSEIHSVVAYVSSLKGTRPVNPKPSQGTEIKTNR